MPTFQPIGGFRRHNNEVVRFDRPASAFTTQAELVALVKAQRSRDWAFELCFKPDGERFLVEVPNWGPVGYVDAMPHNEP